MAKHRKENPTPRSPGGKALESVQFRHRVVPNKSEKLDNRICNDCGWRYEDCECYDDED